MRVSIVIPVYNEAEQIQDCLRAIAAQTVQPFEVIVVDNNSTDDTALLAARFPFVRLLREPRQGVVHARNRGFNAARGDVIGRIDADSRIATDWVALLQEFFAAIPALGAVSGSVQYRDIALPRLVNGIDLFWRRRMALLLGPDVALQGANMAIRRSVWRAIAPQTCNKKQLHEDFDVAIHARKTGTEVWFVESLRASVCYRQANYDFRAFCEYTLISPRTYHAHKVRRGWYMYQLVAFVIVLYPVISALSRGYDAQLGRFVWQRLLAGGTDARVNPATFVD